MPMSVNDWMKQSFKNWLSVGAPLFVVVARQAAGPLERERVPVDARGLLTFRQQAPQRVQQSQVAVDLRLLVPAIF